MELYFLTAIGVGKISSHYGTYPISITGISSLMLSNFLGQTKVSLISLKMLKIWFYPIFLIELSNSDMSGSIITILDFFL